MLSADRGSPGVMAVISLTDGCVQKRCARFIVTAMSFLARDAFIRTNHRAIAMTFAVSLSVCLSGTGAHCDYTVHVSADLSLRLNIPIFWAL